MSIVLRAKQRTSGGESSAERARPTERVVVFETSMDNAPDVAVGRRVKLKRMGSSVYQFTDEEKEDADAERRAVAKSERPWLQLVSILTVTVISILTVVAYRLDILISIGLAEPK